MLNLYRVLCFITYTLVFLVRTGSAQQVPDDTWQPDITTPEYSLGEGLRVAVDAAHGNFHTIEDSFGAFERLLNADGYVVSSFLDIIDPDSLDDVDILVIANPVLGGADAVWVAPTPSAYTDNEIISLDQWVSDGGKLLLIADHMPFAGAAASLVEPFGFTFQDGFALHPDTEAGSLRFERAAATSESGALNQDHQICNGRSDDEYITGVKSFTGQGFTSPNDAVVLMTLPPTWEILLPEVAWVFTEDTARISAADSPDQGSIAVHGNGRIAVFGEAAMFTAQTRGAGTALGFGDAEASDNAQFVLNVIHWLDKGWV